MKRYSIKTVDGNRYVFDDSDGKIEAQIVRWLYTMSKATTLVIGLPDCAKIFNIQNIVSITETEVNE